ncbi:alkylbase DNA N-glycosylase [Kwoniella heveanensis BCC8398]|uniref:Alkylbase DNA N-glycosylase n=1 Tax=Kwoniella heveanensis BCC8398 TaxID=1296120 RepID=A0A1B9H2E4_9TREE|nr:alkylbase DNA N-glycosylase [Kwoniella heveanensis BCC8398]
MPALPTPHRPNNRVQNKPQLAADTDDAFDPTSWLNFSLPPRSRAGQAGVPGSGVPGIPRRSRRGEGWRGGPMSREKFLNASFKFVLKPTETLSYGAHFADPDISLHWGHILQVLVPTFSAFSVAQGYVTSDSQGNSSTNPHALGASFDSVDLEGMGEEAADRRRKSEDERRGRMCPICLGKPVAGRMTKCGHIFCFPCILHYIQLSDIPKSAKCPICGDTVQSNMLKSVKYLDASVMLKAAAGEEDDDQEQASPGSEAGPSHAPSLDHDRNYVHGHGHSVMGVMDGFEETLEEAKAVDAHSEFFEEKGHKIHMRLVQRPQMTTLALPSSSTWPSDAIPPHTAPWYFLPDILTFSRFMLATPDYMLGELSRELSELKAEWDLLHGDELGREFVKAAKDKVQNQLLKVKAELVTPSVRRSEDQAREAWGEAVGGSRKEREKRRERERKVLEREEKLKEESAVIPEDVPKEYLAAQDGNAPGFDNSANVNIPPNLEVEPNPMPPSSSKRSRRRGGGGGPAPPPSIPPSPSYYFYQSSLGANVFLHPLDIRILLAHFKSYSLFPPTLSFTTTGYDPGTINDELRKRCKYLGHLPVGTEVIFVEADLEPIVGKEALMAFEQPLKARRTKRREKVKKEDRAKSRWERAEREKMPVEMRTVPSAFNASGHGHGQVNSTAEDREFALALARSAVEFDQGYGSGFQPSSASSSTSYPIPAGGAGVGIGYSPSSSPSTGTGAWGAHAQPRATFAHALHNHTTSSMPSTRSRDEVNWEVDAAWEAFENMSMGGRNRRLSGNGVTQVDGHGEDGEEIRGTTARESEKGGGGKKGRKVKAQKLVLGGGGGRRA